MIFNEPHFQDKDKAREYLEAIRWPQGANCPHCGGVEKIYPLKGTAARPGLYKCGDCRKQFTVTVGTVFESSKVPLNKWITAVYMMCASKKAVSAHQLHRMLNVTYKTAWFMCHRIREAMKSPGGLMGGGGGTVEVDETFWGNTKRRNAPKKGRGYHHKEKIFTLVERGGRARSFHVPAVNAKTLKPILREQIARDSRIMTDEAGQYVKAANQYQDSQSTLDEHFASHDFVKHGIGEYVRGDVHTNTIESYFAIMKRGLNGTYHHVGPHHLKRYVGEFDFRYNHRAALGYNDTARMDAALEGISGRRLMYRDS